LKVEKLKVGVRREEKINSFSPSAAADGIDLREYICGILRFLRETFTVDHLSVISLNWGLDLEISAWNLVFIHTTSNSICILDVVFFTNHTIR